MGGEGVFGRDDSIGDLNCVVKLDFCGIMGRNEGDVMKVFEELVVYLKGSCVDYRHVEHEPTFTSEESARARGEALDVGAKALLMKVDEAFVLILMSASRKVDSKKVKDYFRVRSLRFATPEELLEKTSLVPGSVPPFGRPVLPFDLYVDHSIEELERVAFNAGSLTDSIVMSSGDYLRVCGGVVSSFSK